MGTWITTQKSPGPLSGAGTKHVLTSSEREVNRKCPLAQCAAFAEGVI